jgi:hypothetical protein
MGQAGWDRTRLLTLAHHKGILGIGGVAPDKVEKAIAGLGTCNRPLPSHTHPHAQVVSAAAENPWVPKIAGQPPGG